MCRRFPGLASRDPRLLAEPPYLLGMRMPPSRASCAAPQQPGRRARSLNPSRLPEHTARMAGTVFGRATHEPATPFHPRRPQQELCHRRAPHRPRRWTAGHQQQVVGRDGYGSRGGRGGRRRPGCASRLRGSGHDGGGPGCRRSVAGGAERRPGQVGLDHVALGHGGGALAGELLQPQPFRRERSRDRRAQPMGCSRRGAASPVGRCWLSRASQPNPCRQRSRRSTREASTGAARRCPEGSWMPCISRP